METEKEKKSLGNVKTITLDLTSPLTFNKMTIEYNKINLLTGLNGSGKSFINTMIYATSLIVAYKIEGKNLSQDIIDYIFSRCFDNKICGKVEVTYDAGPQIEITFGEDGKCISYRIDHLKEYIVPLVIYLSAKTRTFESIKMYLVIRKMLAKSCEHDGEIVMKITEYYKLYDAMFIEMLIRNCPMELGEKTISSITKIIDEKHPGRDLSELKSVDVDLEQCEFIFHFKNGETKLGTQFSMGEQSILVMMLGTQMSNKTE